MPRHTLWIGVIGPHEASSELAVIATDVGRHLAQSGAVLVCGGLGGVMEAACRGAREAGGLTIGLLPGSQRSEANDWVQVALPTGLGEGRNLLVVRAADALIAIGGGWGTLSEIALGLRSGKPVIGIRTWDLLPPDPEEIDASVIMCHDAAEAARTALDLGRRCGSGP